MKNNLEQAEKIRNIEEYVEELIAQHFPNIEFSEFEIFKIKKIFRKLVTICGLFFLIYLTVPCKADQTNLADLEKPQTLQLNYQNPASNPNWVDKVEQARIIEGNQDLAAYSFCKTVRKEYSGNSLVSETSSINDSCLSLLTVKQLVSEFEDTRRGDNKRKSTIQTIGSVAGAIGLFAGKSLIGGGN